MRLAYALLAHEPFEKLRPLLECLTANGDLIALHYDATGPRPDDINAIREQFPQILIAERASIEWGEASIVFATVNCLRALEASAEEFDYVTLLSGSCFPTKSASALREFLAKDPTLEYVEAVDVSKSDWVIDGTQAERWVHPHFFNWRKQPKLFSWSLKLTKLLGVTRKFPVPCKVHMGSQWWTLSSATIKEILRICDDPSVLKFLERTWIPDEFFFQTLVVHILKDESKIRPPLMAYRFNNRGVPKVHTIHDGDRLRELPKHKFFARKIIQSDKALVSQLGDIYLGRSELGGLRSPHEQSKENELAWHRATSMEPHAFQRCPVPSVAIVTDAPHSERCKKLLRKLEKKLPEMAVFGELLAAHKIDYGNQPPVVPYESTSTAFRDYNLDEFLHVVAGAHPKGFVFLQHLGNHRNFIEAVEPAKHMLLIDLFDPKTATLGRLERLQAMLGNESNPGEFVIKPVQMAFGEVDRLIELIDNHQRTSAYYKSVAAQAGESS